MDNEESFFDLLVRVISDFENSADKIVRAFLIIDNVNYEYNGETFVKTEKKSILSDVATSDDIKKQLNALYNLTE